MNHTTAIFSILILVSVFFISFVSFVLFMDYELLKDYRFSRATLEFKETTGTLENAEASQFVDEGGDQRWDFEFDFAYEVDGNRYLKSMRDEPRQASGPLPDGFDVSTIKTGMDIPVFYDPSDPETSTLYRGVPGSFWFFAALLGFFNLVMLFSLYRASRFVGKVKEWVVFRRREMAQQEKQS